jgi:hypothetical protein
VKRKRENGSEVVLLITYADVFSGARPTLAELRTRLAELPKVRLVRVCAVLNAFLRMHANSNESIKVAADRGLIEAYFPSDIAIRIFRLKHHTPPRLVFHRQQLLFVMKEALQYASDDPTLEMTNIALGELFLIANDHMHSEADDASSDTLDTFVKLASAFLPLREAMDGNVRHKMLRSYQMTRAAPEFSGEKPYFDLFALFEAATGFELTEFYAFVLTAMSRFANFDAVKYLSDPSSYGLDESWFSSTKATSEAVQAFFKLTSATPDEYAQHLKSNRGANDFTALRNKPMLRAFSKLDLLDFWMLAEKFESGPFWEINSVLDSQQRAAFHSFWGKLFERYIGGLLKKSADDKLNRVHISPVLRGTNEELADALIVWGQSVVLIESKGTTFTAQSKYEGNYKILRKALESKLVESKDRPQAVKQLAKSIERAFGAARDQVEGLDLRHVRSVFPVLIMRDDLGGVPGVNAFLDLRFNALLNRKAVKVSVAPLTCMSSEIAESLSAYLADTSLVDILEAHIRGNRKGQTRYLTMPLFAVPNAVLTKKGGRPIPNQVDDFDALVDLCVNELGLVSPGVTRKANTE